MSTGVAAIGNFDIAPAPQAVTDAFKQIFAWKFSLAGIPATGTSPVFAPDGTTPLQRVSGHRDAFATVCPGQYLYAKLPEIRTGTAAIMATPPIIRSAADFTGDGKADVHTVRTNGDLYLYRGNGIGGFTSGAKIGSGWGGFAKVFSPRDFNGDGKNDLLAMKPNGELYLYKGNGLGGFTGPGTKIGVGWTGLLQVF